MLELDGVVVDDEVEAEVYEDEDELFGVGHTE